MKKYLLVFVMLSVVVFVNAQITEDYDFSYSYGVNVNNYIGKSFLYNNVTTYSQDNAPYPYVEGRLRAGKYKSSETAFNSYVEQWKGYKNKVFKLLCPITIEGAMGWLFESEEGDTIFYNMQAMPSFHLSIGQISNSAEALSKEFVSVDYLEYLKNSILNKEYVYLGFPITIFNPQNPDDKSFCVKNLKTGEIEGDLPLVKVDDTPTFSIWTVKEIKLINGLPYAIINNKQFGDYQVWIWLDQFEDIDKGGMKKGNESYQNLFTMAFVNKGSLCQSLKYWVERIDNLDGMKKEEEKYKKGLSDGDQWDEKHREIQKQIHREEIEIRKLKNNLFYSVSSRGIDADKIDLIWGENATTERFNQFLKNLYEKLK